MIHAESTSHTPPQDQIEPEIVSPVAEVRTSEEFCTWVQGYFEKALHDALENNFQIESTPELEKISARLNKIYRIIDKLTIIRSIAVDVLWDRDVRSKHEIEKKRESPSNQQMSIPSLAQVALALDDINGSFNGLKLDPYQLPNLSFADSNDMLVKQELVISYLHDLMNPLAIAYSYCNMLLEDLTIQALDRDATFLTAIQAALEDAVRVHQGFDFKNWESIESNLNLLTLINEIRKKEKTLTSQPGRAGQKKAQTLEYAFTYDIAPNIEQYESPLDAVTLIRLLNNVHQNTIKSYEVMVDRDQALKNRSIKIHVIASKYELVLIIDDEGIGFPEAKLWQLVMTIPLFRVIREGLTHIRSRFDGTVLDPFEVAQGKSQWSQKVKGTGTGMVSLKRTIETKGGSILTATRITDGERKGARIEIRMPTFRDLIA